MLRPTNTLREYLIMSYAVRRELRVGTVKHYADVVASLDQFNGAPVQLDDLDEFLVSRWLADLERRGVSDHTRHTHRATILAIWRDAWSRDQDQPIGIRRPQARRVRRPVNLPTAWSPDDVGLLVAACAILDGTFRGTDVQRCEYFRTLIRCGWHSGLSHADLQRLTLSIIGTGHFVTRRIKTGAIVECWLPARLVRQIRAFHTGPEPIWPLWGSYEAFRSTFATIVRAAGLTGPFKRLRISAGTEAERLTGRGEYLLGNSRRVFDDHYHDRSRTGSRVPRLPEI